MAAALEAAGQPADDRPLCAALAVLDVTSGFGDTVRLDRWGRFDVGRTLERRLGPRGAALARRLLGKRDPATGRTFLERLESARDEVEVDRAFRDLIADARRRAPRLTGAAETVARWTHGVRLDDLNPVRTAGPMQVSVAWAVAATGTPPERAAELRERLHGRAEGVRLGVARLFEVADGYREMRHVFADYNGGPYASRNAAFQEMVVALTGEPLVLDGDLMAYDASGRPRGRSRTLAALEPFAVAHGVGTERLRREIALEKTAAFEQTAIWSAVRAAHRRRTGEEPAAARIPDIGLRNPKTGARSALADFVVMTQRRFRRCLEGLPLGVERRAPQ